MDSAANLALSFSEAGLSRKPEWVTRFTVSLQLKYTRAQEKPLTQRPERFLPWGPRVKTLNSVTNSILGSPQTALKNHFLIAVL